MVTVNLDTDRFTPDEKRLRKYFMSLQPTIYVPPDGILPVCCNDGKIRFKLKKPESGWDARGVIDGFFVEEDMRRRFFYPHLPCYFMDVGVAHGSWTLPALAGGASVVGFEIDPRYHETLKESIIINDGFYRRLQLYVLGLYNAFGKGDFQELEDVTFVSLDELMRYLVFRPQYIKIDVEGLEPKVLDGARKTLDLLHPKLFIEIHYLQSDTQGEKNEKDNRICDLLKEFDYKYEKGRVEDAFTYFFFT